MIRVVFFICGCLALLLAGIGVVLPGLPTTPFVLLAASFFSISSPRVEAWLIANPTFGPIIRDWRANGAIKLRYKVISAVAMAAMFLLSVVLAVKPWVLVVQAVSMLGAALYVWTRPSA